MAEFQMDWQDGNRVGERILKLSGPFTLNAVFDFQEAVRKDPPGLLIVDLSEVPYMDSASLGSLLALHVSCNRSGRKYALVGVLERIHTLFRVAGVGGILTICGSLAEAEALAGGGAASA
jgi:anti-anti-sigma factor